MLDWNGGVYNNYSYEKGKATLVVIGRAGQVIYRTSGAASGQELARVYSEINRLLYHPANASPKMPRSFPAGRHNFM